MRNPGVNGLGRSKTCVKSCNGSFGREASNTARKSQSRIKKIDTNMDMRTPEWGFGIPSAFVKSHS